MQHRRIADFSPNAATAPPLGPICDDDNTPTFKMSLMHNTCDQIFQRLCDVSDLVNDENMQKLCADLLLHSQEMIKTNVTTSDINHHPQPTGESHSHHSRSNRSPPAHELRRADSLRDSLRDSVAKRMANVVEDEIVPRIEIGMPSQERQDNRVSPHGAYNLFTRMPKDDGNYNMFLNIYDTTNQDRHDYLAFKRSDSNVPLMLLLAASGGVFVVTGFVWTTDMNTYINYPTALLSVIFALLALSHLMWITLNRVILLSFRYNIVSLQRYHEYVIQQYNSSYGQVPDNCTFVFTAMAMGFYLVNIICMDICDPNVMVDPINHHTSCGSLVAPPPESFVLTMVIILVLQIIVRVISP